MVTTLIKPEAATDSDWVTQLRTWLDLAVAEQAAGKAIITVQAGDASSTKMLTMSPQRRIEQLIEALVYYDTTTDWSDFIPVKRTSIRFL